MAGSTLQVEAGFGVIPLLGNVHERVHGRAPVGGSLVGNNGRRPGIIFGRPAAC
jgi:hypothetical protein